MPKHELERIRAHAQAIATCATELLNPDEKAIGPALRIFMRNELLERNRFMQTYIPEIEKWIANLQAE